MLSEEIARERAPAICTITAMESQEYRQGELPVDLERGYRDGSPSHGRDLRERLQP